MLELTIIACVLLAILGSLWCVFANKCIDWIINKDEIDDEITISYDTHGKEIFA